MTKRLTIFISVGEEWINNQFASWMKDNLMYVEMFCISRRTTRNYFWNPFLHALYIANVIINGVWYYFQCKFSCSYFKIHSSKPRLTDTTLHGHLFFYYRWFSWSQRYQSPFSFHFAVVSIFLTQSSVPLVSRKSGFTVLTSTLKLLIVLTTILFVYVTLHFFHHYSFNVSWSEIVILIFKLVDKILYCYHGLPIWHILFAFIYFCCQKKIMLIFFLNPHEQLNNVSFQYFKFFMKFQEIKKSRFPQKCQYEKDI